MKKIKNKLLLIIVLLAAWDIIALHGLVPAIFLPSPEKTALSLKELFDNGLWHDILVSSSRIFVGFILSVIIALPIGLILNMSQKQKNFISPVISFLRYTPPSALIPLFILWFGVGEAEKIVLIIFAIAPFMIVLTFDIAANTKPEYIETAKTMGASDKDIITKVLIPHSLPQIWDGSRFLLGAAWSLLIMAEIVGANSGLGYLLTLKQRFVRTDAVVGLIIVIGSIGILIDNIFEYLYPKLFPWTNKSYVGAS